MLHIDGLRASVGDRTILDGVDLDIPTGEVHAIMGPNGAGKTTLSHVLTGRDGYEVSGTVEFDTPESGVVDLLSLEPEERAAAGVFLAFQNPVEIPGVGNMYFLRTAVNAVRTHRGLPEISATEFLGLAKEHMARLEMDPAFLSRAVNDGFSGGEKKRNEMLQLSMLEPRLAILDETDSGLDIDAVRIVTEGIRRLRSPERSMLIITHHPRLLHDVQPDRVHVLDDGRILRSGGLELVTELETTGFGATQATVSA